MFSSSCVHRQSAANCGPKFVHTDEGSIPKLGQGVVSAGAGVQQGALDFATTRVYLINIIYDTDRPQSRF